MTQLGGHALFLKTDTIWGETYDGGWSATPNILYEDWLKKFESIIVVSKVISEEE